MMLLALIPLFFLPFTQNLYDTNKWMILVALSIFVALAAVWQFARTSRISLSFGHTTMGLTSITLASLISLFIASTNKTEALLTPFGPITFAALTLISIFSSVFWNPSLSRRFLWILFSVVSFLGCIAIYQFAGVANIMFPHTIFLANPLWTPTGSAVATTAMLLLILPLLFQGIREGHKHKQDMHLGFLIFMTVTVIAGLGITVWQLTPKLSTLLLSPSEGWIVLLETLKAPRQALAGIGAENFLTAFTAGRPAHLNLTPLWTTRFATNTNILFHIATVYGLMGAAGAILFLKSLIARKTKDAFFVSLLLGFLALLLIPPNLSLLVVVVGLCITSEAQRETTPKLIRIAGWVRGTIFTICILAAGVGFYGLGRMYAAEIFFAQALTAAAAKDGTATYNLQIKAIQLYPKATRFHIANSQTSLALAVSLSKTIAEKAEISEKDKDSNRNLAAQLIQRAITEAKTAVDLNPISILAWENLARAYQQLIGITQDADTWAVTTYSQTITLDPYNPILTLELGGVYVQMKKFSDAITQFTRATKLKPDYANAWYNLANVYRLNEDGAQTIMALEKTQRLVHPDSQDYRIITQELEDARNPQRSQQGKTENVATASGILTTPAPIPIVIPPLELP